MKISKLLFIVKIQIFILLSLLSFETIFAQNNIKDIEFHLESRWYPKVDTIKGFRNVETKVYFVNHSSDTVLKENKKDQFDVQGKLTKRTTTYVDKKETIEESFIYSASKIKEINIQKKLENRTISSQKKFLYRNDSLVRVDYYSSNSLVNFTEFSLRTDTLFVIQYDARTSYNSKYKIISKKAYRYDSLGRESEYIYYIDYLPENPSYSLFYDYKDKSCDYDVWGFRDGNRRLSSQIRFDLENKIFYRKSGSSGNIEQQLNFTFNSKNNWVKCSGNLDFNANFITRNIEYY